MSENKHQADDLTLYHQPQCPFCTQVRQVMDRLGLEIALRDVQQEPANREELIAGGGKGMVPCLRIDNPDGTSTWMYESSDISDYLTKRFPPAEQRQG